MYRNSLKLLSYTLFVTGFLTAVSLKAQITIQATADASVPTVLLSQLWGDHYDLSITDLNYSSESSFQPMMNQIQPRSWRCSVGRWEIGTLTPVNGASNDTNLLKTINREYYRGGNDTVSSENPANYNFNYLDSQLVAITQTGALPYLCFDYMPLTLSAQKNPANPDNYTGNPIYSFSNGIRTARPSNPVVYAYVVLNVIRHVRGQFAGTHDFGIDHFEIGNEPDLPLHYFYTGNAADLFASYHAIAQKLTTSSISTLVKLGCASFCFFDTLFASSLLSQIHGVSDRIDFVSYHSYNDTITALYSKMLQAAQLRNRYAPGSELINGEWGHSLNGANPFYDKIDHGLFRAKIMMLMEVVGIKYAHESLFLAAGSNQLGLVYNQPVSSKPSSDVYLGFNKMNDCLNGINLTITPGEFMLAGKSTDNTKVCLVYAGDSLAPGISKTIQLRINNLPWGSGTAYLYQYAVSQNTWSLNQGVHLERTKVINGNTLFDTLSYGPGPGQGRLVVWKVSSSPLSGIQSLSVPASCFASPNPAQNSVHIHLPVSAVYLVSICSAQGMLMQKTQFSGTDNELDLDGLAPGVYFIQASSGKSVFTQKLVKY